MLISSEGFLSLVQKFFDEIGKNEAALLNVAVVVFHRLRCPFPGFCREGVVHLGSQHERMHACRINGHMGIVHAHNGKYIIHRFKYIVYRRLLHNGGLGLLHKEPVFAKGREGALIEVPGKKSLSRSDGIGAVNDDDVVEVLHFPGKGNAVAYMDMKFFRRISKDL